MSLQKLVRKPSHLIELFLSSVCSHSKNWYMAVCFPVLFHLAENLYSSQAIHDWHLNFAGVSISICQATMLALSVVSQTYLYVHKDAIYCRAVAADPFTLFDKIYGFLSMIRTCSNTSNSSEMLIK
jgi:hypothetical protein